MKKTSLGWTLVIGGLLSAVAAAATYALLPREPARRLPQERTRAVMYVALGDSTVAGVGASGPKTTYVSRLYERLRAVYPEARMVNLGVSGATAADVVREQLRNALALRPDLVTLSIGPNDITRGRDVQQYERDIETILRRLTRETAAVLVVNLIPDIVLTPRFRGHEAADALARRVVTFNAALTRQIHAYRAEVVDLYTRSRLEVPERPELIGPDGYHPSDPGYARWAELMWERVETRIDH